MLKVKISSVITLVIFANISVSAMQHSNMFRPSGVIIIFQPKNNEQTVEGSYVLSCDALVLQHKKTATKEQSCPNLEGETLQCCINLNSKLSENN